MKEQKPTGLIQDFTKILVSRFETAKVGDTISYVEMLGLIHKSRIDNQARGLFARARKIAHEQYRILFGTKSRVGFVRLSDEEIVRLGPQSLKKIQREAARSIKQTLTAQYDALSEDAKVQHNTNMSMMGAIAMASTEGKLSAIKEQVLKVEGQLSYGATLDVFK